MEKNNENQITNIKKDHSVEKFIVCYSDGTQKTVEKGFFCEMKEKDAAFVMDFIMANISGKELVYLVSGCIELGIKLGLFDTKK